MRRVHHRPPAGLVVEDVPVPEPGPGQLLVRSESVGVTLPMVRRLRKASEPLPLGGEAAGTVEAAGSDTAGFTVGDRVTGLVFVDAYAEFALLSASMAAPVPDGATSDEAVALVRGGVVALGALEAARPRPGERALITGAASGVGHLALQLARAHGRAGHVTAAVSDTAYRLKAEFLRGLGADEVLPYSALNGEPGDHAPNPGPGPGPGYGYGPGYDYVLDAVGGELLTPAVRALAPGGRLIAYSSGGGTLEAHELLLGAKTVTGFQIARIARERPADYAAWRERLWELRAAGLLRTAVAGRFPLERAAEAHALITGRRNLGRVLLRP